MAVKVSPKYQVVIPESVRNSLNIQAGSKMEVIVKGRVAYLVPVLGLSKIQEMFKGKLNHVSLRDKKDRF